MKKSQFIFSLFTFMVISICVGCQKSTTQTTHTEGTVENFVCPDTIPMKKQTNVTDIDTQSYDPYYLEPELHLRVEDTLFIRWLQAAIARGDKKAVANMISYPLVQCYPLKPIQDAEEFVANYDQLFPADIRQKVAKSTLKDWSVVGWRGAMYDCGQIWFDKFGEPEDDFTSTKIYGLYLWDSTLYNKLVQQERQWIGFSNEEVPVFCQIAPDSSFLVYVTIYSDYRSTSNSCRLRIYLRENSLNHPIINTQNTKMDVSSACWDISAKVDSLFILVWDCNDVCEICQGCLFSIVDKDLPQDEWWKYKPDTVIEMTPCYLRDVVKWW